MSLSVRFIACSTNAIAFTGASVKPP